ncbi:MAG: hypothetical protein A2919_00040 [Candidatus Spechtbacteria bacterium RIFCSPLOWO2_01_FULL_43_12]|uniref:HTH cro/C1-type domain-containing protein n=1 Tax=Candidatus Spechtbacteria bacterium RIFCSPLOWO2_01_FULL_43_12 TaxID=1802162 RepID=A0A1G2HEL4_9BACT|nr:MAG: hypothetical protein A2919_00040 [Candidatus Spechtbacteria bacterium RIFCSPLOWO2_01_FULL_43_12]
MKKFKFTTLSSALAQELKSKQFRKVWEEPTGDPYLDTALTIIKMRKKKKLTQSQLAQKAGTTQQVIARLESLTYRSYSLKTLEKLAKALGKKPQITFV